VSTRDVPSRANLNHEQICALLAEHRGQAGYEEIVARPGSGWIIFTASHVLPDGTMDEGAGTRQCLDMYDADNAAEETL
jgi:hypothetical protein